MFTNSDVSKISIILSHSLIRKGVSTRGLPLLRRLEMFLMTSYALTQVSEYWIKDDPSTPVNIAVPLRRLRSIAYSKI